MKKHLLYERGRKAQKPIASAPLQQGKIYRVNLSNIQDDKGGFEHWISGVLLSPNLNSSEIVEMLVIITPDDYDFLGVNVNGKLSREEIKDLFILDHNYTLSDEQLDAYFSDYPEQWPD
ncbi:MAG: hypothetical protein ACK5Z2_18530 [Bacteroidota bacterium]|jgi:hypothetical protein